MECRLCVWIFCLLVAWAAAQQHCLPGQQKCLKTCCDTDKNFTCCPYNGGYCAPPDAFCCPSAKKGTCLTATEECCSGAGCYDPKTENCCEEFEEICPAGACCTQNSDSEQGVCLKAEQQCCNYNMSGSTYGRSCPNSSKCCYSANSMTSSPQFCCGEGAVCCDNDVPFDSPVMRAKMTDYAQRKDISISSSETNYTGCANPENDFCCEGLACPTTTLCCSVHRQYWNNGNYHSGCCFGFESKDYSCVPFQIGNFPPYTTIHVCPNSH